MIRLWKTKFSRISKETPNTVIRFCTTKFPTEDQNKPQTLRSDFQSSETTNKGQPYNKTKIKSKVWVCFLIRKSQIQWDHHGYEPLVLKGSIQCNPDPRIWYLGSGLHWMDPQHRNLSCQQICLCHVISSDRSERSSLDKRHTPHLGVVDFLNILWGQRSLAPALCNVGLGLVFLAFLQPSHIFPVLPTSVLMQHKHYVRFALSCLRGTYWVSLRDNISVNAT